jgi:hypothetical protein
MAIWRFPPLLFLFPCGFHVFAFPFGWFWSITLWSVLYFIQFLWY